MANTKPNRHLGLVVAATTAWSLLLVMDIIQAVVMKNNDIIPWITGYVLFGLITAYIFTFLIGYPLWKIASYFEKDTLKNATIIGLLAGLIAGSLNFNYMLQAKLTAFNLIDLALTVAIGGFAARKGFIAAGES